MKTGRPRKPSALKLIQGTLDGRRVVKNEAHLEIAIPDPPPHLSGEARAEWDRICPELASVGLLARADRAAMAAYCKCWADWVNACIAVDVEGITIIGAHGGEVENPKARVKDRTAGLMHRFLVEFGLTPASRSRIEAKPPTKGGIRDVRARWEGFGS
jgi:P27 family predicted phage terminase small subunit